MTTYPSAPYQLLPELSPDQFAALKADIAERGVLVAIELDEHGQVLDGHHRLRAWRELRAGGVAVRPYPRVIRRLPGESAKVAHALRLNLTRRHLEAPERRVLAAELRRRGLSLRVIGDALGVSVGTVHNDVSGVQDRTPERIAGADGKRYRSTRPRSEPAIVVNSDRDERRAVEALRTLGESAPGRPLDVRKAEELGRVASLARRRAEPVPPVTQGPSWRVERCDFRELDLADESVDAIVCDPPYTAASLPLWSDLSAWAARVLKPGRLLVAYAGKMALPDHLGRLGEHLDYVWAGATIQPGRRSTIRARMVLTWWRPWLVYSAGPYEPRGWLRDTLTAEGRGEKGPADHPWRQTLGPFVELVTMVTEPGELVVDPFLGQGTTAIAAIESGRRFLGCDVDPAAISLSLERLGPGA